MQVFPELKEWLAHLETAHPVGIDMGLERISRVKEALGLQLDSVVITVGGTNGKGSTCAMLESVLLAAGYRVGCHTSPHLLSFNERARVGGEIASDAMLLPHFEAVEHARCSLQPAVSLTYFEFTTLAILHLFASQQLDAVILEVGLGGRLDAVNILDADCAIVTSIDLDHMQYLGNTREAISLEKAGIFRAGKPAICGDPMPPAAMVEYVEHLGADLWLAGRDFSVQTAQGQERQQWSWVGRGRRLNALGYPALRGANQLLNAAAVLAALQTLRERLPVSVQDIRNGLALVELPGRFQVLAGRPTIVMDVAHNPHAAATLRRNLDNMGFHPYTYGVLGAMADKDVAGMLKYLTGKIDHWNLCDLPLPRAASAGQLEAWVRESGFQETPDSSLSRFATPEAAYADALSRAGENDRIVVFGSFLTVAGAMTYRKSKAH